MFCQNIDQVIEFMEMIKNESGQIDVIRVDQLDYHISVKKTAIEQEFEAARKERKEKKKDKKKHKKQKKDYVDYDED